MRFNLCDKNDELVTGIPISRSREGEEKYMVKTFLRGGPGQTGS